MDTKVSRIGEPGKRWAEYFAEKGYFFVKFNFSHNGTTTEKPTEFLDIEAFGENNYIKELDDFQTVIDWLLLPDFEFAQHLDVSNICLVGHSRGGGIALIKASEDKRVTRLITLSAVSDFGSRFPGEEEIEKWQEKGVTYITNTRTGQQLPHHFQFYTNYKENEERLDISRAAKSLEIPHLIVHGSNDTTVPISDSGQLFEWSPYPDLLLVESADHVYDVSHPWKGQELPVSFTYVLEQMLEFLKKDQAQLKQQTN
ncbi:alpha/beta fold hydrolase [Antarcticibacterium sp. 1MA-6-2]|uniref:alpha/beta hydrolase family protein n=1 Tax=Antarcticibacterium sp. 1MA-6-2 TaxID=2908210 RepID=UPI0028830947|nr:alpha/beta fold hydrolase [Antarcticibacterium sp. 1MA-6-2]